MYLYVFVILCFFDYCFILKFPLCFFLCFYTYCPCSAPLITLICWRCAPITCHTNRVSFVTSWFHIKINVFHYKCCLCFSTFFRLLSQLSDPLYLCLHPLSSTNLTNVFPPYAELPVFAETATSNYQEAAHPRWSALTLSDTKWLVIKKDSDKFGLVCFLWWTTLKVFTESDEKKLFNKGL